MIYHYLLQDKHEYLSMPSSTKKITWFICSPPFITFSWVSFPKSIFGYSEKRINELLVANYDRIACNCEFVIQLLRYVEELEIFFLTLIPKKKFMFDPL